MCCWNEIEYIPKCVKFYQQHGIHVVVADNKSDDGSWEWLNDNKIDCFQFDTSGMFSVGKQQQLRLDYIKSHPEYDWIIYGDSDEYPATQVDLLDVFRAADDNNCNVIRMKSFELHNTGEKRGEPTQTYFYYSERYAGFGGIERIHKNVDQIKYLGDLIKIPGKRVANLQLGNYLNYGNTKTPQQREGVYQRRKLAWEAGVEPRSHGSHYAANRSRGFKWDKNTLKDIREHHDWSFIKEKVVDFTS